MPLRFIIDTGAARTIVDTGIIDELGYSPRGAKHMANLIGAGSVIPGYTLDVVRLEVMGVTVESFKIVCQDLPRDSGVDGLVGMDLLADQILTVDSIDGRLTLAP